MENTTQSSKDGNRQANNYCDVCGINLYDKEECTNCKIVNAAPLGAEK